MISASLPVALYWGSERYASSTMLAMLSATKVALNNLAEKEDETLADSILVSGRDCWEVTRLLFQHPLSTKTGDKRQCSIRKVMLEIIAKLGLTHDRSRSNLWKKHIKSATLHFSHRRALTSVAVEKLSK
jgi:hypothetical protein